MNDWSDQTDSDWKEANLVKKIATEPPHHFTLYYVNQNN